MARTNDEMSFTWVRIIVVQRNLMGEDKLRFGDSAASIVKIGCGKPSGSAAAAAILDDDLRSGSRFNLQDPKRESPRRGWDIKSMVSVDCHCMRLRTAASRRLRSLITPQSSRCSKRQAATHLCETVELVPPEIAVHAFGATRNRILWWVVGKLWLLLGAEPAGLGCPLKIYFHSTGIPCYMNDNIAHILKSFGPWVESFSLSKWLRCVAVGTYEGFIGWVLWGRVVGRQ